jgi:hypothetical protein
MGRNIKADNVDESITTEIEDIERLRKTITERFSK